MRTIIFRVLAGTIGLVASLAAVMIPLLFISNELQEAKSARQYGGHVSFWGAIGGSLKVLIVAVFFALIAYVLLKFSVGGPKTSR